MSFICSSFGELSFPFYFGEIKNIYIYKDLYRLTHDSNPLTSFVFIRVLVPLQK